MLKTQSQGFLAPGIGARVFQFYNDSNLPAYIVIENRDASLSMAIEYQESDNGTTWSAIAGTSQSITPGGSNGQIVVSAKRIIALFCSGNVQGVAHVARHYNGLQSNLL